MRYDTQYDKCGLPRVASKCNACNDDKDTPLRRGLVGGFLDCHAIFDKIFFLQNPLAMTWILDNSVLDFRIYTRRGQRGLGK